MNEDDLRARAKAAGIKSYHNKKVKKLEIELSEIDGQKEEPPKPKPVKAKKVEIIIDKLCKKPLEAFGFKNEWLLSLANQYNFNKLEYVHKFRAFRCYQESVHVDWIDVNDLSLLNGGRTLTPILLKHQRVSEKRQIIKYHWR